MFSYEAWETFKNTFSYSSAEHFKATAQTASAHIKFCFTWNQSNLY